MCDSFFDMESNQNFVSLSKLYNEVLFENVFVSKNFVLIKVQNNILYLDLWKKYSKSFNFKKDLFLLEDMVKLENVKKFYLSHNLYYLDNDNSLYVVIYE